VEKDRYSLEQVCNGRSLPRLDASAPAENLKFSAARP
jgi:hypothetical protein